MTNGDRVRKMTNEELADALTADICQRCVFNNLDCGLAQCKNGVLKYLNREEE